MSSQSSGSSFTTTTLGSFFSGFDLDSDAKNPLVVNDPELLFSGAYERVGDDLVITRPFESAKIHDYFVGAERRALYAPDGTALSGATVAAITLHGHTAKFAQNAATPPAAQAIGRIEVVRGGAHAIRNGESVTLHVGDLVFRGDAVQTDAQSVLSLTFLDGTAFTLESNARMVLNELVYDANSTTNSSLMTLVQGSIGFVAGDIAHRGEMKVDTPVATIGIRGTAVHVVVEANHGRTHFSVMREPNGRVGRYVLYDHNDPNHVLATVAEVNAVVTLDIVNGVPTITTDTKPPTLLADENALTNLAFQAYQLGQEHPLTQQLAPGGPNGPGAPNTPNGPNNGNGGDNNPNGPDQSRPGGQNGGGNGGSGGGSPPLGASPDPTPGQTTPGSEPNASTGSTTLFVEQTSATLTVETSSSTTATTTAIAVSPTVLAPAHANPIDVISSAGGGVVGFGAGAATINLLAGVTDSDPNAKLSLVTNSAGEPAVTVSVVSGNYNPANLSYTVAPNGALQMNPQQSQSVAPGTTVTLGFSYTLTDGVSTAPQTAQVTIDGGSAVSYGSGAPIAVGSAPVMLTPTVTSPEGGDTFAIDPPGVLLVTQKGDYGTAVINSQTGQLTYTPSAAPGASGVDTFTISDKDSAGVTTKTTLSFAVDGGALAHYADVTTSGAPVPDKPVVTSAPEPVASYAFETSSGAAQAETGAYGTAEIAAGTGVITYTPSGAASGTDTFQVAITDSQGVVTSASAAFVVALPGSPTISGATNQITHDGAALAPFAEVAVADPNAGATETLTITQTGGGSLTGAELTSPGVYTLTGTPQAVSQALDGLSFAPVRGAPNSQTTTTFALSDASSDNSAHPVNATVTVTDVESAVAPTIAGASAGQTTHQGAALAPFADVTVADSNVDVSETVTIALSGGGGSLSGAGLTSVAGVYTLSGSSAQVTQELDALSFAPTRPAPDSQATTTFTLTDSNGAFATPAVDASTTVTDVESAVAPTISGVVAGQTVVDGAALSPFAGVTVADANSGATETLTITQTGGGDLSGAGSPSQPGVYTLSGSAAAVTQELRGLIFTPPTPGGANTQTTTSFSLSDASSAHGVPPASATTTVTDVERAVAPAIFYTTAGQTTADGATISPFADVLVDDPNAGASETLTIALSGGGGTLSGNGLTGGSGAYELQGTAAQVTQELDALSFAPTRGLPASQTTTTFTLTDKSSAFATPAVDSTTTVTDVEGAVAPTIAHTVAGQATAEGAAIRPFADVLVGDPNAGASETLTIALSGGGGTLSGSGLTGGLGSYELQGTAAAVTQELDALSFAPTRGLPASQTTTTFTLTDKSSAIATPAVNSTTTVTDVEGAVAPTIAHTVAGQATAEGVAISPFVDVLVDDPNAGASETLTIALSGGGGILSGAGLTGGSGSYELQGTAAQVTQELDALSFAPTRGLPGSQTTTTFKLTDTSSAFATPAVDSTTTVTDVEGAVPPTIAHTTAGQTTADGAALEPFAGVTVGDPNAGASDTLTIALSGAGGTLSGAGLTGGSGSYELQGTAAQVTQELDALSFAPTPGPPASETTTTFTLTDTSSAFATPAVDSKTTVTDVEGAVAPTILNTAAGQTTSDGAALAPFAGVTVDDPNAGANDTLTIALSGGGGALSGAGLIGGSGSYELQGTAAQVTQELDALSFAPTRGALGSQTTTTFTLTDTSSADATPAVDSTTTVTDVEGVQPVISITTPVKTVEGVSTAVPGVSISEAGATSGETFTVDFTTVGGWLADFGPAVSGSTIVSITGTLAGVNEALSTLTFLATTAGASSVTMVATDPSGLSSGPAEIDFVTPPLSPEIPGHAPVDVAVGVATAISGLSLVETGASAGETFTVTVSDQTGSLTATGAANNGTSGITLTGDLAAIDAALATLTYTATAAGADTITLAATDSFDNSSPDAEIAVSAVPLRPVISVGVNPLNVSEGAATPLSGLSLSEFGAPTTTTYTVALKDTYGDLSVSASGATVSGENSTSLTISGSLADVNAALATLTDTQNSPRNDLLTVSAIDSSTQTAAAPRTVAVAASDISTSISAPQGISAVVGAATAISGLNLSVSGAPASETFTATLSDAYGALSATGAGVTGSGTTTLTIAGSLSQVNAALATVAVLEPQTQNDGVAVSVVDNTGDALFTQPIPVTAVGPLRIAAPASVTEPYGVTSNINAVSLQAVGAESSEHFTVTVSDTTGQLYATGAGVSGSGSNQLTIAGTFNVVQSALNTLEIEEPSAGADTVVIAARDSLGQIAATQQIAVAIGGALENYSWQGASTDLGAASNWSVNEATATSPPSAFDNATFSFAAAISGAMTAGNINFSNAITIHDDVTTTVVNNTLIALGGSVTVAAGANGGQAEWIDTGNLVVGNYGVGALTIEAGGVVRNESSFGVGALAGGSGTLNIEGGGELFTSGPETIGNAAGSSGVVSVSGTGSEWISSSPNFVIGNQASGSLTLSADALVSLDDQVTVGADYNGANGNAASGEIVVETGATLTTGGNTAIGQTTDSVGTVTVESAGLWNAVSVSVGDNGGTGTLTIDDGRMTADTVAVGGDYSDAGATVGSLIIEDGGSLYTSGGWQAVGQQTGGEGRVTILGAGSLWNAAGTIALGANLGSGTLTISEGGAATVNQLQVGENYNGPAGTTTGALQVLSGGTLTTTNSWNPIGAWGGATGTALVDGAGSSWTTYGELVIGSDSGNGALTVSNDALVTAANIEVGDNFGGPGTVGSLLVESGGQLRTHGGWNPLGADGGTGTVTVTGAGSSWIADGGIGPDDSATSLTASDGGRIQAATGIYPTNEAVISVDATSSIEAGSQGGAAAGYLTVDPLPNNFSNLWGAAVIDGNVMDLGNVYADHGTLAINGSVSGDGFLVVGGEATLSVSGAVTVEPGPDYPGSAFGFGGWYGTLALADPNAVTSLIHDFVPGDTIDLSTLAYSNADSGYYVTPGNGYDAFTFKGANGSATLDFVVSAPMQGELYLTPDAAGTGTDVEFLDAPAAPFTLWSTLGNFFTTPTGPYATGATWSQTSEAGSADPVWVASETTGSGAGAQSYNIVIAAQNSLGQQQAQTETVATTTLVDPFGTGNLGAPMVFVGANYVDTSAAVIWWQASATTQGEYDIKFETFTNQIENVTGSAPAIALSGNIISLDQGVISPTSWDVHTYSSGFILEYATAASETTENVYLQAFNTSGQATTGLVEAFTNVNDNLLLNPSVGSDDNLYWTESSGAQSGEYGESFNPNTGALGTPFQIISASDFSTVYGAGGSGYLSNDDNVHFVDGVLNGEHVIQVSLLGPNLTDLGVTETIPLQDLSAEGFQHIEVFDNDTGKTDYTVLAYLDAGQVHLYLFDDNGKQIGAGFVVPGATSLLRLHDIDNGPRFEIDYTVPDGNGGQNVVGAIYDIQAFRTVTTVSDGASGYGLYAGSPYDDVFYAGTGVNVLQGGGGVDTFDATAMLTAAQTTATVDPQGDVVVSDGAGDIDTLIGFSLVKLADATISINGDTLTETLADGGKIVSTFNIGEEPYARTVANYNAQGLWTSETYYNADGSVYFQAPATVQISAETPVETQQGFAAAVAGLAISEAGAASGEIFTVTVSDQQGELTASGAAVSGSGGTSLTITGSLADVNAALATVAVTESGDAGDTLTITAQDNMSSASSTASVAITTTPAPVQFSNASGGDWNTASNWSTGAIPGATDNAAISLQATVTISSGADVVNSLAMVPSSQLDINGGTLTITAASDLTGTVSLNGGQLLLQGDQSIDSGVLFLGGVLWNADPSAIGATLTLGAGLTVFLQGDGGIYSTNASASVADVVTSYATIDTSGGGTTYIQPNTFVNHGTIAVDSSDASLSVIPTNSFLNYGSVYVGDSEQATLGDGFVSSDQPGGVTNESGATITATTGASVTFGDGAFVNNGQLQVEDSARVAIAGPVSGSGEILVQAATLTLDGSVASGQTIELQHVNGFSDTVALADPADFAGEIAGITLGDAIDLSTISPSAIRFAYVDGSQLDIQQTNGTTLSLALSGQLAGDQFTVGADSANGALLTLGAATSAFWLGSGGDWSDAANWANGVTPTSSLDVSFEIGGADIVTVTTAATAGSLTVDALGVDIEVESGGSLIVSGAVTINGGTLDMAGGEFLTYGPITIGALGHFIGEGQINGLVNNGYFEAAGNFTLTDAVGTGAYQIDNGVTLEIAGPLAAGTVTFGSGAGQLTLDDPADFHAVIAGVSGSGDVLFLNGVTDVTSASGVYNPDSNQTTLTVDYETNSSLTFTVAGDHTTWTHTQEAQGVAISDPPAATTQPVAAATVDAGSGDHLFLGGGGDTFVFTPLMGNDAIAHFAADPQATPSDVVDLKAFHIASYQALLASAQDTPEGELLDLAGHTLVLEGVHKAELHSDLFIL